MNGRIFNPDNEEFRTICNDYYVDKTGLISLFDSTLNTKRRLVLSTRPRRFGKSFAAQAVVAFYSNGCDSRSLFEGLEVSQRLGWDNNLNSFNVIYLDICELIDEVGVESIVGEAKRLMLCELRQKHPEAGLSDTGHGTELTRAILDVVNETKRKFVFVIDEWDAPYRLSGGDTATQDAYASMLRSLFKGGSFIGPALAGAFMTGILPIKKYAHQSAVSNFREYTMLRPGAYAPFVGFTEDEVEELVCEYDLDMVEVKNWYDGYELRYRDRGGGGIQRGVHVVNAYAPYSVMMACDDGAVGSFWPSTEAYETILPYIELDLDGLQGKVVELVSGNPVHINPDAFRNDIQAVRSADEALTLLCHLGYLTFDGQTSTVRVPNEEVRSELAIAVSNSTNVELVHKMQASRDLLARLIAIDEQAVADGISEAHERECTPLFYNNEHALRAVVKSALVATVDSYGRFEELGSGHGFADICYIPKAGILMPAILVELKWNQPVEAAIAQIKNKGYYKGVTDLGYPLLLVGITYEADTDERRHTCRIETWRG